MPLVYWYMTQQTRSANSAKPRQFPDLQRFHLRFTFVPWLVLSTLACSGAEDDTQTDDNSARTFQEQVEDGATLYGEHCAHCHGDSGQGTDSGPQVVGDGALPLEPPPERMVRMEQFETALDVFVFASEAMPGDDPGGLTDQQMVDVLAFALFANGVTLDEPLDADNAGDIVINPVE